MSAPELTAYRQGLSQVSADNLNTFEQTCDTYEDLRAFVGVQGNQVYTRGRLAPNDGGQGTWYWVPNGTGPDNNSTIIVPTGAAVGCWAKITESGGGGSGVSSFNGRTGAVVSQTGDYSISQIVGAGTMAGQNANAVAITGGTITGMPDPVQASDVANKHYVDTHGGGGGGAVSSVFGRTGAVVAQTGDYSAAQISGLGTMATQAAGAVAITGGAITGMPTPVAASDVVTKAYVDRGIYPVFPTGGDDTSLIQSAHDAAESALGGTVYLARGATFKVNGGLIWDPRLVGLEGNGATLDFSAIVPGNVGTNLVTGDSSTFTTSTGSWSFTNANGYVSIQTVTIGGTPTPGDVLTVTATSASITGSPVNMTYTVLAGDSISDIVRGLATSLNNTSQMIAHGVVAVVASNDIQFCIYITQSITHAIVWSTSASGGATETISNSVGATPPTGMLVKNTTSAQGAAILSLSTTPGVTYCVNYEMHVQQVAQINVAAQINSGADAINFCAGQTNTWFVFTARATTTYLQAKVSTTTSGDAGTIGQVTVQVGVPPAIWHWDRSNGFANVVAPGSGYSVGDTLTVLGGVPSTAATIVVSGVDGSGRVTYAQVKSAGTYSAGNYPTNPVSVSGGTGTGATFNIGISTPQFGHEAYPLQNFIMIGPGRNPSYTVDSVTPFSLYSGSSATFGLFLDSPVLGYNRNSTSSRGTIRNVEISKFTVAGVFINQAYLAFPDEIGISNSNIGWLTTNGQNAGENIVISRGFVTGCDLLVCLDSASLKFDKVSMDYPRQAMYRINGTNAVMTLNECHEEYSPPGDCAKGSIAFSANPSNGDTITLNGVIWTFVTGSPTGNQTQIQATLSDTLALLVSDPTATVESLTQANSTTLAAARYTTGTVNNKQALIVTYKTGGTAGNSFTLAASAATPSGATLTGGFTGLPPIVLSGAASVMFKQSGEHQIGGEFPGGSFSQVYLTSNKAQSVIWKDVQPQTLGGYNYLMAGAANANIASPCRLGQFPTVCSKLSDALPRLNFLDIYGMGGFENPAVATSTVPNGLVFVASSLDQSGTQGNNSGTNNSNYTGRVSSQRGNVALTNSIAHTGSQCLAVTKTTSVTTAQFIIYLLAPVRPGYQHWWDFWLNVPTPTGSPTNGVITLTQDYVQLAGVETIFAQSNVNLSAITNNSPAGYPPYLSGVSNTVGQQFVGTSTALASPPGGNQNSVGGILLSLANGTNGWMNFQFDTFNHGYAKAPAWADHIMLKMDLTGLDNATTWNAASGVSVYLDDIFCWQF